MLIPTYLKPKYRLGCLYKTAAAEGVFGEKTQRDSVHNSLINNKG
jgi:hypothetical protein